MASHANPLRPAMSNSLILGSKTLSYVHTAARLARNDRACNGTAPGVLFCGGFRSDMRGTKAMYLQQLCEARGWQYTRFDYCGHGTSSGEFIDCGIHNWRDDTLAMLDRVCLGPHILVGSSMGLWMVVLATLARPERVAGIVGIAGAPDMTERLIWRAIGPDLQARLQAGEIWYRPSEYDDGSPYPISMQLVESGRPWLLLDTADDTGKEDTGSHTNTDTVEINCPVRLLHGTRDNDVPWQLSQCLLQQLTSSDATLTLVKDADHRLSEPGHLALLENTVASLMRCQV